MLSTATGVAYIHEPFNPGRRLGLCGAPIDKWYQYICAENEHEFSDDIEKTLRFVFNPAGQWRRIHSFRALAGTGRVCGNFLRYRLCQSRPLLKAPMALFSAPWLAERFDMHVVLIVRHPGAVASSLKGLRGAVPVRQILSDLLDQPLLMRDHLYPFEDDIRKLLSSGSDILDQAALLWKVIYHVALKYTKQHPDWTVIRYVDLARDPLKGCRELFYRAKLEFGERQEREVHWHCSGIDLKTEEIENPWAVRRNSSSQMGSWRSRLTRAEISRVRSSVEEVAHHFYADADW